MATYIILSKISPGAFRHPKEFKQQAEAVSEKIKRDCPGVKWKDSYAALGRFDVVDIIESDDPKEAERAAMLIRAYGYSSTEVLSATPWREFIKSL